MAVLTILFVGIFFAAWKAPQWVKEIGIFALAFGFFALFSGLRQMFEFIQNSTEQIQTSVIGAGLKVAMIPVLYGLIIYMVSLIIRIIQKPRM